MNSNSKEINFKISELQGGAVQERVDAEVKSIMSNILDMNTGFKIKRKLTIDITFEADESRQVIATNAQVKSKLAPAASVATTILTGRDYETGIIQAAELKSAVPGQTFFDPSDNKLKTDTGEEIEEVKDPTVTNIIDYNQKNQKTN